MSHTFKLLLKFKTTMNTAIQLVCRVVCRRASTIISYYSSTVSNGNGGRHHLVGQPDQISNMVPLKHRLPVNEDVCYPIHTIIDNTIIMNRVVCLCRKRVYLNSKDKYGTSIIIFGRIITRNSNWRVTRIQS